MKAKKAMKGKKKSMKKAMKSMKRRAMKVSTVAKNKLAKLTVWRGTGGKVKTSGGLTKANLVKNKNGKVVSKKKSLRMKNNKWAAALVKARKQLKIKGFAPIKKGSALYKAAKSIYKK